MICWRSGGAQELRLHAQVVVKVHFQGATNKHPGGYRLICWRSGGARELRSHAQLRVTVPSLGASSKQPGGYIATNTAYYKLHKLHVGWIFMDFHGWGAEVTCPVEGNCPIPWG